MKKFASAMFATLLLTLILSAESFAITWFPQDFNCPIDNEKNTFMVVGSYGSYIYFYPSKYQWLFFPVTDSPTYYVCKKCHLATYMWDFDKIPKDKIPELKKALADVKISKPFTKYTELPVVERMEIMAKVYAVLGWDDEEREQYHRTLGYHYGKAGMAEKALAERKRSLELLEKFAADPKSAIPKKLLLYIRASMKHFTGDDVAAIADLETALKTQFQNPKLSAEDVKNSETGLNERINDYIARIKSAKDKPRMFDSGSSDDDH